MIFSHSRNIAIIKSARESVRLRQRIHQYDASIDFLSFQGYVFVWMYVWILYGYRYNVKSHYAFNIPYIVKIVYYYHYFYRNHVLLLRMLHKMSMFWIWFLFSTKQAKNIFHHFFKR